MPGSPRSPFAYVVLRVVPHVERGEYINAGIILWSRPLRFLGARVHLDPVRLASLSPGCDPAEVREQLDAIARVAAGDRSAGPIARLTKSERFHWLASPSSTVVQRSEVHTGMTADPTAMLEHLFEALVAAPEPAPEPGVAPGPDGALPPPAHAREDSARPAGDVAGATGAAAQGVPREGHE